jgi:hypothetical protein
MYSIQYWMVKVVFDPVTLLLVWTIFEGVSNFVGNLKKEVVCVQQELHYVSFVSFICWKYGLVTL